MKGPDFNPFIDNFTYYNFSRSTKHSKATKYSGGIGIFIENSIRNCVTVHAVNEFFVWIKVKKFPCIHLSEEISIGCVYIPPFKIYDMLDSVFQTMENELARHVKNKNVMIVGDFNARTGEMLDVLDSNNAQGKRYNQDKKINYCGKKLIKFCRDTGLIIVNGRFFGDKGHGRLTYYCSLGSSCVDYLLICNRSTDLLTDFFVDELTLDSDHCPLNFAFGILCKYSSSISLPMEGERIFYRYRWQPELINKFNNTLYSEQYSEVFNKFVLSLLQIDYAGQSCNFFMEYLTNAAGKVFKIGNRNQAIKQKQFPKNYWFDDECKQQKRECNTFSKNHDLSIKSHKD